MPSTVRPSHPDRRRFASAWALSTLLSASALLAANSAMARTSTGSASSGVPVVVSPLSIEIEPNDTPAQAMPLTSLPMKLRADLFRTPFSAGVDVDVYAIAAQAGDRLFAATMTQFSSGSTDTRIEVLAPDGVTVLESDDNDGTFSANASNVAGVLFVSGGTHYLRVSQFDSSGLQGTIRPYDLYVSLVSGPATLETEPNNLGAPQALPAGGWVSGTIGPVTGDVDSYSIAVNAGDTIVAIMDVDPERDAPEWNGRVGIGPFNSFFPLAEGSTVGGASDDSHPSEAMLMTVNSSGTYEIVVDHAPPAAGSAAFTYSLSVLVVPAETSRTYTTYAGTGGAISDADVSHYVLSVPDARLIGNLRVVLNATHAATGDLDVSLTSPDGNEVVLFDDLPAFSGAAAPQIDLTLDDEAAVPISASGAHAGMRYAPESFARLAYFRGMQAQGDWTLNIHDDAAGNTGTLNSWALEIGEDPPVPPCVVAERVAYSTDLETDNGGFSHTGTQDDWEYGTPVSAPIVTAHSGVRAWKTDLNGSYNANSDQDLLSPVINLGSFGGRINATWWQKFRIQSASADSSWVEVREAGVPTHARRLWEWKGATQTRTVGATPTVIQMSAGWARMQHDISDFAGLNVQLVFHLDSDATTQLTGLAIDDVSISECPPTAVLVIEPPSIDFDEQVVGSTSVATTVTLTNNGDAALNIVSLGAPSAPFARSGGTCSYSLPLSIPIGGSCTLQYTFAPVAVGSFSQTLDVTTAGPALGSGTIELLGAATQGRLSIAPAAIDFGDRLVGSTSSSGTIVLSNSGDAALAITVLDAATAPFARSGGDCSTTLPFTLAAGAGCNLEYSFIPGIRGAASQSLNVIADAPGGGSLALSGNGVQGVLEVTPDSVSFGNVTVGQSSAFASIILRNTGDSTITVNSLTLASPPFVRTNDGNCGNSLPLSIDTGSECTITYRFDPVTPGSSQQSYTLGSNAIGETAFQLQGDGVSASVQVFSDGFE